MLRDNAVAIIKQRMGNNNDSSLDAHIVTEMQLQQEILERTPNPPWFLNTVKEQEALADGFVTFDDSVVLSEVDGLPMFWSEATLLSYNKNRFLMKDDWPPLAGWSDGDTTDTVATNYAKFPDINEEFKYILFPTPDTVAYKYYLPCYVKDSVLSTNIENRWLKHAADLMIAQTGAVIAGQYVAFEKFAAAFVVQQQIAQKRLTTMNTVKEEENIRRMMGDS